MLVVLYDYSLIWIVSSLIVCESCWVFWCCWLCSCCCKGNWCWYCWINRQFCKGLDATGLDDSKLKFLPVFNAVELSVHFFLTSFLINLRLSMNCSAYLSKWVFIASTFKCMSFWTKSKYWSKFSILDFWFWTFSN